MRRELNEALAVCLARLEAGENIEACLRGHEAFAAELRPLLEAVSAVRGFEIESYSPEGFQGGRSRLRNAVRRAAERKPPTLMPAWPLMRRAAALALATVVAAVALLAFTTDVFRFGAGSTEALEGVIESVDAAGDVWWISTSMGKVKVNYDPDTPVTGATGERVDPHDVTPGTSVRIRVEENDEVEAVEVEIEGEDEPDQPDERDQPDDGGGPGGGDGGNNSSPGGGDGGGSGGPGGGDN